MNAKMLKRHFSSVQIQFRVSRCRRARFLPCITHGDQNHFTVSFYICTDMCFVFVCVWVWVLAWLVRIHLRHVHKINENSLQNIYSSIDVTYNFVRMPHPLWYYVARIVSRSMGMIVCILGSLFVFRTFYQIFECSRGTFHMEYHHP